MPETPGPYDLLSGCVGFDWDGDNSQKNWQKHLVSVMEWKQAFFNLPLIVSDDSKHSQKERRFYALGQTSDGRLLFVVFTVRRNLVRVISARDMHWKEREAYLSS